MLRVVYKTTTSLDPRSVVQIIETRGHVVVELREGIFAEEYLEPLNAAIERFIRQCGWFQIWRGRIICAVSPDRPLVVRFVSDPDVSIRMGVQIREDCGEVRLHVCPDLPTEFLVRALNPALEKFLAGGQWFQLWAGEIVTMDSPELAMA